MKTLTLHLEDQTAADLECLARAQGASVESVAVEALRGIKVPRPLPTAQERLQALKELQKSLALTPEKTAAWLRTIEEQRF